MPQGARCLSTQLCIGHGGGRRLRGGACSVFKRGSCPRTYPPQQIELVTRDDSSGPGFCASPVASLNMLTSRRVMMKQVFEAAPGACSMGLTRHF